MNNILLFLAIKYNGDWNDIAKAVSTNERVNNQELENCLIKYRKINYVTILDINYPRNLLKLTKPPFVLFYKGDIKLLDHNPKIAVIGSRKNSANGAKNTIRLIQKAVMQNQLVVSGMAQGIDAIAQEATLSLNGKTIAVLGSGINNIYPKSNSSLYNDIVKKGLVISEFPNNVAPHAKNFKIRNRIVAALVDKIFVIEAKIKSGTMNTVKWGLEIGNEIYCSDSPGPNNAGCQQLIKEGAYII